MIRQQSTVLESTGRNSTNAWPWWPLVFSRLRLRQVFFLEESDAADFGSGVVVLDSIADVAVAGDQASHLLHAKRKASSKKYIRCRRTSGGTGDALVGADLVLMQPKQAPVS